VDFLCGCGGVFWILLAGAALSKVKKMVAIMEDVYIVYGCYLLCKSEEFGAWKLRGQFGHSSIFANYPIVLMSSFYWEAHAGRSIWVFGS